MLSKQQMSPKCNQPQRAVFVRSFCSIANPCKFKSQCFQLLCSYPLSVVLRFNHWSQCIFKVTHQLWTARSSLEYRHLLEGKPQLRNYNFLSLILPVFHYAPVDWRRLKEHDETLKVQVFLLSFYCFLPHYNSSLGNNLFVSNLSSDLFLK